MFLAATAKTPGWVVGQMSKVAIQLHLRKEIADPPIRRWKAWVSNGTAYEAAGNAV
jgi:hypothetical protein